MATTVKAVKEALENRGLAHLFDAIDSNPATPAEVVLWAGGGRPVYSVREAVEYAQQVEAEELALLDD